ncbi:MAG TPA: hypothetical protein VF316_01000 [Polyangiaceae bacterium]
MGAILLAPGAEENGLAVMLSDLVRQNLEAKPHKRADFDALEGSVAIVAEDADVALTLRFSGGKLTIFDGIVGIPDVALRASADIIIALSNVPLSTSFALPFASWGDKEGSAVVKGIFGAMRDGSFRVYGGTLHMPMMMRLTRVMSVNG